MRIPSTILFGDNFDFFKSCLSNHFGKLASAMEGVARDGVEPGADDKAPGEPAAFDRVGCESQRGTAISTERLWRAATLT
jgi:hypothetical protein